MAIKRMIILQYFISNMMLLKNLHHRHFHFGIEALSGGKILESKVSVIINKKNIFYYSVPSPISFIADSTIVDAHRYSIRSHW